MTVRDILPHCPDEKRCLLNFKLGTPIRDVEKYYGMSLFMLACHYCQTDQGDAAKWLSLGDRLPSIDVVLSTTAEVNERTSFNPMFCQVMAVCVGTAELPAALGGEGALRRPQFRYCGDRSGRAASDVIQERQKKKKEKAAAQRRKRKRDKSQSAAAPVAKKPAWTSLHSDAARRLLDSHQEPEAKQYHAR
jgi:hypothetical protein